MGSRRVEEGGHCEAGRKRGQEREFVSERWQ